MQLKFNVNVENPRLDELLQKRRSLSKDRKDDESEILRELTTETVMNAEFITVVRLSKPPVKNESGTHVLEKNSNVSFIMVSSTAGESYLPLFSSRKEMELWQGAEKSDTAALSFDDIAQVVQYNSACMGVTLNPFSDNLVMPRKLIESLIQRKQIQQDGRTTRVLSNDTPIEFPKNDQLPIQLCGKLCEQAKELGYISRMWLRNVRIDGSDGYLLIVDFDNNREETFRILGDCARPFLESKLMNIVSLNDKIPDEWTRNIIPTYSKT